MADADVQQTQGKPAPRRAKKRRLKLGDSAPDARSAAARGPGDQETPPADAAIKTKDVLKLTVPEWPVAPSSVDFEEPLLSCLSILAAFLHRPISSQALRTGLPLRADGFTPDLCVRAAERAGLAARIVHRQAITDISPVSGLTELTSL